MVAWMVRGILDRQMSKLQSFHRWIKMRKETKHFTLVISGSNEKTQIHMLDRRETNQSLHTLWSETGTSVFDGEMKPTNTGPGYTRKKIQRRRLSVNKREDFDHGDEM